MENLIGFDYVRKSKLLIRAGIVGVVLSLLYLLAKSQIIGGSYPSPISETIGYVAYYLFNSFLVVISGLLLRKKNKVGLITFWIAILSIVFSWFVPGQDVSYNLFLATLATAGLGIFWVVPPIGTIYFFYGIIVNFLNLGNWKKVISNKL